MPPVRIKSILCTYLNIYPGEPSALRRVYHQCRQPRRRRLRPVHRLFERLPYESSAVPCRLEIK